jgi:alcohol dehydrogenase class IV
MNEFSFSVVPDVLVGAEISQRLGDITAAMGMQRVLIVTDPVIVQLGLLDGAIKNLESNHVTLSIYSDVVADPPESVVTDAVVAAQEFGCDGVIGFGGGSSMDVAKLLAVLIKGQQSLTDIYGVDQITSGRLPLIQVPTTAGTGSEATMVSIITTHITGR